MHLRSLSLLGYIYIYICIYTRVDLSLYSDIVSGHIVRRSDVKLTDSMFCLCIFLLYFRWMVDREVDGQHVFSLIFFFDIFDGWSIVKLTGSMFFFDGILQHFR